MAIVGIIGLMFLIAAWDVPRLIAAKEWRDLAVFGGLLVTGTSLGTLQALGVKLPNLTKIIQAVYHPVAVLVDKLLS